MLNSSPVLLGLGAVTMKFLQGTGSEGYGFIHLNILVKEGRSAA
jgi:5-carboxymethyl-2-hydroxymuconate isomerase